MSCDDTHDGTDGARCPRRWAVPGGASVRRGAHGAADAIRFAAHGRRGWQLAVHVSIGQREGCVVGGLVMLGIVLLVAWGVLWLGFNIVSGLVHLLVVVAVALIIWGLLKRGARAVDKHV